MNNKSTEIRRWIIRIAAVVIIFLVIISADIFVRFFLRHINNHAGGQNTEQETDVPEVTISGRDRVRDVETPEWIDKQLIEIDGESRRGRRLDELNDIVIHYVGNPGTTAQQNRNYFSNPDSEVSSHFVVGLEGEIIQCVPLDEMSSASNWRNGDTISIEVCHPDTTGQFNDITYASLVKLTAWLLQTYGLDENHIIRHYDVTGKLCPLYYVEHEEAWVQFKADVKQYVLAGQE
ncbi:MAG: N-acetylmuramoyl-L-alanine amidase [Lachnospiraceae bacterium]|nr:N-acetylmuramoyl-L-alanine amidase [Lachnospiraceae bacterium]